MYINKNVAIRVCVHDTFMSYPSSQEAHNQMI